MWPAEARPDDKYFRNQQKFPSQDTLAATVVAVMSARSACSIVQALSPFSHTRGFSDVILVQSCSRGVINTAGNLFGLRIQCADTSISVCL